MKDQQNCVPSKMSKLIWYSRTGGGGIPKLWSCAPRVWSDLIIFNSSTFFDKQVSEEKSKKRKHD